MCLYSFKTYSIRLRLLGYSQINDIFYIILSVFVRSSAGRPKRAQLCTPSEKRGVQGVTDSLSSAWVFTVLSIDDEALSRLLYTSFTSLDIYVHNIALLEIKHLSSFSWRLTRFHTLANADLYSLIVGPGYDAFVLLMFLRSSTSTVLLLCVEDEHLLMFHWREKSNASDCIFKVFL